VCITAAQRCRNSQDALFPSQLDTFHEKLDGCRRQTVDRYIMPSSERLKFEQVIFDHISLVVTLAFDLLISKSNRSSLSPTAPKLCIWSNSHKRFVRYRDYKLLVLITHGRMHGQLENRMPSAANCKAKCTCT